MTLDEHQTKPAILEGLADYLRATAAGRYHSASNGGLLDWALEVDAVTRAITQVGEEQ